MGSRGKEQSFDPIRDANGIRMKQSIRDKQARPHSAREWGREEKNKASTPFGKRMESKGNNQFSTNRLVPIRDANGVER
jgi:hypothetical protein